jgi:type II secretory pathway component GspD/PulD (secretin)
MFNSIFGKPVFSFKDRVCLIIAVSLILSAVGLFAAKEEVNLLEKKVTINAVDASISSILSTMAKMSGTNIVLSVDAISDKDKDEEPKITVSLKEIPIEEALSLVVKAVGLSYRLIGENTFLVGESKKIQEEVGERSYVVTLNNVNAKNVVKALESFPGKAVELEGQNAIMIHANPISFAEMSKRIQEFDIPQKQVEIRARLIEISVTDSKKMGIDWSKLNHLTTIIAEDPMNQNGVGLPYNYSDVTGALPHGSSQPLGSLPTSQYFQKMDDWSNVGRFSRQLTAFDITVNWLLENSAAKLLTDTRLTALSGEKAEIHIGEVVPFVVTDKEYNLQVEREQVGIKLNVSPTVNKDGQITVVLAPEVSSVIELVAGYVPRTKVRRINSTVTVPNGSKIIVGGLLSSNLMRSVEKVPLLGSIPFIGRLFQHVTEHITTTDLIIEITPSIIDLAEHQVEFKVDERLERRLIEIEEDEEENEDNE